MKTILNQGDSVGIIACSDGRSFKERENIDQLLVVLTELGLHTIVAKTIYRKDQTPFSGTPQERAHELMALFTNPKVKAIFDISGGDSANQVLPELDYALISKNPKPFFGYSDLSVLLNGLFTKTGLSTYHYQVLHLVGDHAKEQQERFSQLVFSNRVDTLNYHWIRGDKMSGTVVGGNIRCFLKLAGTDYLPDPTGKILFLESQGGGANRTASLLAQLDQIGYFKRCHGVLLGTFTELEKQNGCPSLTELVCDYADRYALPVAKTSQLGHGSDSHCLLIGGEIELL